LLQIYKVYNKYIKYINIFTSNEKGKELPADTGGVNNTNWKGRVDLTGLELASPPHGSRRVHRSPVPGAG